MSVFTESSDEQLLYTVVFKSCLLPQTTDLDMARFRTLFSESNLSKEDLKTLYVESVKFDNENRMTRPVFGIFCKFLALKMANLPTTIKNLSTVMPIPKFLKLEFSRLCEPIQPESDPRNPQWESKFEISKDDARRYVDYICTRLNIDRIEELDTVVLLGKGAKTFFEPFQVGNELKRDLWLYLDRGGENKLRFFFVVLALHFLTVKVNYDVWILDLFKQRDFDERFKGYFSAYMTRSHKCHDIDEFFKVNFGCTFYPVATRPVEQVELKPEQDSEPEPDVEFEPMHKATPSIPTDHILRKNSEIDEPRCIPQKTVTCQDYTELYNNSDNHETNILERLKDNDRSKMFSNVLGYLSNNIAIHQKRQSEFAEQVLELETEKQRLLIKLESERDKCKQRLGRQGGYLERLRRLDLQVEELDWVDDEDSDDQEDVQEIVDVARQEWTEEIQVAMDGHLERINGMMSRLGQSGQKQMLQFLEKRLKKYN